MTVAAWRPGEAYQPSSPMTIVQEMLKVTSLDELQRLCELHGMGVSIRRDNCLLEWMHFATLAVVRAAGKIECSGKGGSLREAVQDAANNLDKMLRI